MKPTITSHAALVVVLAFGLAVGLAGPVAADTLYFEDFNGGTQGQLLTGMGWTWSGYAGTNGDIRVGATTHGGWSGLAVVGALSPSNAVDSMSYVRRDLVNMPTSGVLTLTFDAWAYDVWSGGAVMLETDGGAGKISVNPWKATTPGYYNVWTLWATGGFTGGTAVELVSPENFLRGVSVKAALHIDYDAHLFWATLFDGLTTYDFGGVKSPFSGTPKITGIEIMQDLRWVNPGTGGADFDNIGITSTAPAPEPASLLLIGTGLLGLRQVRGRRRR